MPKAGTEALVWQHLDGQLDAEATTRLKASASHDAEVRRMLSEMTLLDSQLRAAIMPLPAPSGMIAAIATLAEEMNPGDRGQAEGLSHPSKFRNIVRRQWWSVIGKASGHGVPSDNPLHGARLGPINPAAAIVAIAVFALFVGIRIHSLQTSAGPSMPQEFRLGVEAWFEGIRSALQLRKTAPVEPPTPLIVPEIGDGETSLDIDNLFFVDGRGIMPLGPNGYAAIGLDPPIVRRDGPLEVTISALYSDGKMMEADIELQYQVAAENETARTLEYGFRTSASRTLNKEDLRPAERFRDGGQRFAALPDDTVELEYVARLRVLNSGGNGAPDVARDFFEYEVVIPLDLARVARGELESRRAKVLDRSIEQHGVTLRLIAWYRDASRLAVVLQANPSSSSDRVSLMEPYPEWKTVPNRGISLFRRNGDRLIRQEFQAEVRDLKPSPSPTFPSWTNDGYGMWNKNRWPALYTLVLDAPGLDSSPPVLAFDTISLEKDFFKTREINTAGGATVARDSLRLPPHMDVEGYGAPGSCCMASNLPADRLYPLNLELDLGATRVHIYQMARLVKSGQDTDMLVLFWKPASDSPSIRLQELRFAYVHRERTSKKGVLPWLGATYEECGKLAGYMTYDHLSGFDFPSDWDALELCAMKPILQVDGPWSFVLEDGAAGDGGK